MLESQSPGTAAQKNISKIQIILDRRLREAIERDSFKAQLQNELTVPCVEEVCIQEQFPFFPPLASAMPTQWTRTGLFSNVKKGERRIFKNEILEGRSDYRVRMSGEELDMYDNDVFLHAVQLAQGLSVGEPVYFERAAFLRAIGRGSDLSAESYCRLHESIERLASATIFVDANSGGETFRLIDKLKWGQENNYWIMMDPMVVSLFANSYLAFVDMEIRLRLKSPLSKYLQNYISGHSIGVHRVAWESLRKWSGSRGRARDFKTRALPPALRELEGVGVIEQWCIRDEVVNWTRIAHAKSKRRS
ncbi:plasmid replication initiator TrfA [Pseudomonas helleri]|uniref:plasmid replication initiator TrfA n=1 Tax=Pseudomonas helleri TaxID=1608996 RepID=UPI003F96F719